MTTTTTPSPELEPLELRQKNIESAVARYGASVGRDEVILAEWRRELEAADADGGFPRRDRRYLGLLEERHRTRRRALLALGGALAARSEAEWSENEERFFQFCDVVDAQTKELDQVRRSEITSGPTPEEKEYVARLREQFLPVLASVAQEVAREEASRAASRDPGEVYNVVQRLREERLDLMRSLLMEIERCLSALERGDSKEMEAVLREVTADELRLQALDWLERMKRLHRTLVPLRGAVN